MYVSKKLKHIRPVNHYPPITFKLVVESVLLQRKENFIFKCYRYPCGRLKLVCFSSGMFITGDPYKAGYDVIFDSVRSLYTVPGFTVHTDPIMVYAACGLRPYGIK